MSQPNEPRPYRIGDAERDEAVGFLREHLAQGRLDSLEFDERLSQALTAKTRADLEPLFADLPAPRPGHALEPINTFQSPPWQAASAPKPVVPQPPAKPPVSKAASNTWAVLSAIAWPAAIIICFATNWQYWWIMLIPMFFPWWLRRDKPRGH